jgi:hypothetical protein
VRLAGVGVGVGVEENVRHPRVAGQVAYTCGEHIACSDGAQRVVGCCQSAAQFGNGVGGRRHRVDAVRAEGGE